MNIDIVIPHYGKDSILEECLSSFDDNSDNVIVIDNNDDNRGFSNGVNDGIQIAMKNDNPYIAIVNNDTTALKNAFQPMIDVLDGNPKCSIVSPKVVNHANHDQIVHAGGEQCFPNGVHRSGLVSLGQHNKQCKVKWVSFAVVMLRKEALRQVGHLDPNMFLICSDSDWCYRARSFGWECEYTPDSVWSHKMGESNKATSKKSEKIQKQDMYRFYKKWIAQGSLFQELDLEYFEQ